VYFIVCTVCTLGTALAQFIYQIVELTTQPDDDVYKKQCSSSGGSDFWLRQLGLIRIPGDARAESLYIVLSDLLPLLGSLTALVVCSILETDPPGHRELENETSFNGVHTPTSRERQRTVPRRVHHTRFTDALIPSLKRASDVCLMFFVVLVGIVQPSLLNAPYFIMFLIVLTWWALYTPLRRLTFNRIKCLLAFYTAVHFTILFAYQIPFFQDRLPSDYFAARLLGLTSLMQTNCGIYWKFELPDSPSWTAYVNYALTLLLYFTLIVQYHWTQKGIDRYTDGDGDDFSSVHEELLPRDSTDTPPESVPLHRMTSAQMDRQKISGIFR
ncbi:FAM38A protein 1, partial [Aphelenchoides avenae]